MAFGERRYRLIDLFSGCGGMTLGFLWDRLFHTAERNPACQPRTRIGSSPFRVVWANDSNDFALQTYRENFDRKSEHSVAGRIELALSEPNTVVPQCDVIIGGPPCQGFSLLNKNGHRDIRRELWWQFIDVAERAHAKVLVMENVQQLLGSHEFETMKVRLSELGYHHLMAHVLCAANYGVPQVRNRAIIMASRCGPIALPLPTHASPVALQRLKRYPHGLELAPWISVRRSIGQLPPPIGTELRNSGSETLRLHFGRQPTQISLDRYRSVPPGGNRLDLQRARPDITPGCWLRKSSGGTDLFGRLWWDRPSVTIRTEFYKPEKGRYLHPEAHRAITHREAARLQSFPDSFVFLGPKAEIARQIGNAVPPLLAYAIARRAYDCLRGETTVQDMHDTEASFRDLGESIREVWYANPGVQP